MIASVALVAAGGTGAVLAVTSARTHRPAETTTKRTPPAARSTRLTLVEREAATLSRLARRGLPVYCGGGRSGGGRRLVALTFDDGPGPYTHLAVRILRAAHARATFFLVGRNLARWPAMLRAELTLGALGNHTWTHPYLPSLARAQVDDELRNTKRAIEREAGVAVRLFRPPYGVLDDAVGAEARSLGMVDVLWSLDSLDWHGADWRQIATNVLNGIRPGSIVLMHENRGQTIRALKFVLLPQLRALHWRLVTVPELLTLDPPTPRQLRAGKPACA